MNEKSPQEQKRLVFLLAGLGDTVIGIFFILVGLRIIPIFSSVDSWILFLIGGLIFTTGAFVTIFNFSPRE